MKNAPGGHQVTIAGYVRLRIIRDIDSSPPHAYIGRAWPGTPMDLNVWDIVKVIYDGNGEFVEVKTVRDSEGFDQVWNDRVGLDYV